MTTRPPASNGPRSSAKGAGRRKKVFLAVLAALLVAGFFVQPHHAEYAYQKIGVFQAFFGLVGSLALVFISKGFWAILKRPLGEEE